MTTLKWKIRNKQRGFSFIEMMIVIAIGSIVSLAAATVLGQTAQNQSQAMTLINLDILRRNMISSLASETAWSATLAGALNSSGMACLNSNSACTVDGTANGVPIKNKPMALYDVNGNLIYDATNGANGVTAQGTLCNTFSTNGNDNCPFRFTLSWSAVCTVGNCTSPQILVSANLLYAPAPTTQKLAFNPNLYSINGLYLMPTLTIGTPGCDVILTSVADFSKIKNGTTSPAAIPAHPVYCLANDIDFGGAAMPTASLTSLYEINLNGQGFSIKNFNSSLNQISYSQIANVTFANPEGTSPSYGASGNYGGVAGEIDNSVINQVSITGPVTAMTAAITSPNGSCGVLAGMIQSSTITTMNLNFSSLTFTNCSQVGSLAGEINDSTLTSITLTANQILFNAAPVGGRFAALAGIIEDVKSQSVSISVGSVTTSGVANFGTFASMVESSVASKIVINVSGLITVNGGGYSSNTIGGIAGIVADYYTSAPISGSTFSQFSNCQFTGSIIFTGSYGQDNIGGAFGIISIYAGGGPAFSNITANSNLSLSGSNGGLVGGGFVGTLANNVSPFSPISISTVHVSSNITISGSYGQAIGGGFAGMVEGNYSAQAPFVNTNGVTSSANVYARDLYGGNFENLFAAEQVMCNGNCFLSTAGLSATGNLY